MRTVHLLIKGKVQGVFYRATAKKVAKKLSISGWIKNTPQGDVESLITGTDKSVDKFIQWCKQGPADAVVDDVILINSPEQLFADFQILR